MRLLALSLVVPLTADSGTAYRYTGPDGVTVFSDRPGPSEAEAATIKLPDAPVRPNVPVPEPNNQSAEDETVAYTAFEILAPANGDTIRSSAGKVDVRLRLEPTLLEGGYIELVLDGQLLPGKLKSTNLQLNELPRGAHTLYASVLDAGGGTVQRTKTVRFTMRQDSVLLRQNTGIDPIGDRPPPPDDGPGSDDGRDNGNGSTPGGAGPGPSAPGANSPFAPRFQPAFGNSN